MKLPQEAARQRGYLSVQRYVTRVRYVARMWLKYSRRISKGIRFCYGCFAVAYYAVAALSFAALSSPAAAAAATAAAAVVAAAAAAASAAAAAAAAAAFLNCVRKQKRLMERFALLLERDFRHVEVCVCAFSQF